MPANISSLPPASPEARPPSIFNVDLARPETWPALLRISDICRNPKTGYPGILPMTRSAFLAAVEDGYIKPGIKLGAKVIAWRKPDILHIVEHGVVRRREQGRRAKVREGQRRAEAEVVP
jgi:hypothetical protein